MSKATWLGAVAAACAGAGLLWHAAAGDGAGIGEWQTLNAEMAEAVGWQSEGTEAGDKPGRQKESAAHSPAAQGEVAAAAAVPPTEAAGAAPLASSATEAGHGEAAAENLPSAALAPAASPAAEVNDGRININTATAAELDELPGIGAAKAQAIVEYRQAFGPFRSLSDLGEVKGIGAKMLQKLEPEIRF